jgi:SAM-dependent methyltransferase
MPDAKHQPSSNPPSPIQFFDTVNGYQRTAAIKAAVELDLFTAIGQTDGSAAAVAKRIGAAERGVRILADFLTICGFLTKSADRRYALTADSAAFLDRRSPAYLGGSLEFLLSPLTTEGFDHLADSVRRGGTAHDQGGTTAPDHPIWMRFARAMMPMMAGGAEQLAAMIDPAAKDPLRVLDVSASHGMWGLALARRNTAARVTGLDWPSVLEVAKENAVKFGVADRYDGIAGSAFEANLRGPYDLVLLPNFLHHFDAAAVTGLLKRVRTALAPGGRVVTVDFIPNEDRVTPPSSAVFAIIMLSHTPGGDAYTFADLEQMFRAAGFTRNEVSDLPRTASRVIVSRA